jgi:hypothetical protein
VGEPAGTGCAHSALAPVWEAWAVAYLQLVSPSTYAYLTGWGFRGSRTSASLRIFA